MPNSFRSVIVVLLFAATMVHYIDRSVIAFAAEQIQSEFGLSSGQLGFVLGAFGIGYILSTLVGGMVVDRIGMHIALAACLFVSSFAMGWAGLASGFVMLCTARMLLGLAEGPCHPAMAGALNKWLPPDERATAMAGALVAVPLALAIGSPLVAMLTDIFGWRSVFYLLCFFGFLFVPIWFYFFSDEPADSPLISNQERLYIESSQRHAPGMPTSQAPSQSEWYMLLTNPTLLANYWAYFVFGYFVFYFMSWMPKYLQDGYGLGLFEVGYFAFFPWIAAAAAVVMFGRASDTVLKQTKNLRKARSLQIAGSQLVAALAVIPIVMIDNLYVAIASITLVVAATMAASAAFHAVITDMVPRVAGTAMGIMTVCLATAGFLAPVVTGYALDLTGSYDTGFWTLTALALSSVIAIVLFHHPDLDRGKLMRKLA